MGELSIHGQHIRLSKIVGENEDGMTLFIPKSDQGSFEIKEGDQFLTLVFVKPDPNGGVMAWTPWE